MNQYSSSLETATFTTGNLHATTSIYFCSVWTCFIRYYFGRSSSELAELFPLSYSRERYSCYFDRLHDFTAIIPKQNDDNCVYSSFLCAAKLWNFFPVECFPLTYDLNSFRSTVTGHLSFLGHFYQLFFYPFLFSIDFCFLHASYLPLFLEILYLEVAVKPCMEWNLIKNVVIYYRL